MIVEDDYDSEFRYEGSPVSSLFELTPETVIYLGSFSKILASALRLGFAIVPESMPPRVSGGLIPIEGITRKSHYLASLGNVSKLGSEVQKPGLVFDDVLIETFHWGISVGMVPG